jgi:hypothetical protein
MPRRRLFLEALLKVTARTNLHLLRLLERRLRLLICQLSLLQGMIGAALGSRNIVVACAGAQREGAQSNKRNRELSRIVREHSLASLLDPRRSKIFSKAT